MHRLTINELTRGIQLVSSAADQCSGHCATLVWWAWTPTLRESSEKRGWVRPGGQLNSSREAQGRLEREREAGRVEAERAATSEGVVEKEKKEKVKKTERETTLRIPEFFFRRK